MVFVLSNTNKKLMPTNEYRARKLLKSGKATIYKYRPFTIKLTEREDGYGEADDMVQKKRMIKMLLRIWKTQE